MALKSSVFDLGAYIISPAKAEEIYPLRLLVLRPGGTLSDCRFDGDDLDSTFHLKASDEFGNVLAIASFYEKSHPQLSGGRAIQLRGMASHPEVRGLGYGKALVNHAIQGYTLDNADLIWCNAREVAVVFYERLGFISEGEPFDIPGIGLHYRMHLHLR